VIARDAVLDQAPAVDITVRGRALVDLLRPSYLVLGSDDDSVSGDASIKQLLPRSVQEGVPALRAASGLHEADMNPRAPNKIPDQRVCLERADLVEAYSNHADRVNAAVVESIENGIASSCSLMVPCPAAPNAMRLLRERPHIPFGIRLTLIRGSTEYRWDPPAVRADVASLLDPDTDGVQSGTEVGEGLLHPGGEVVGGDLSGRSCSSVGLTTVSVKGSLLLSWSLREWRGRSLWPSG
jgi:hypothetical protein